MSLHALRFVRALAFAGTASLAACTGGTGAPCSLQGQACTVGEPVPGNAACCRCYANSTAIVDAGPDAADGGGADVAVPGTYSTFCVGPLTPPEVA